MSKVAQYHHPLRVNVRSETFERLEELAREEHSSISQVVRDAIRSYLKARER